jgi:hypothetical protein
MDMNASYYTSPNPNPDDIYYDQWRYFYFSLKERADKKAKSLCDATSQNPSIVIPSE